MNSLRLCQRWTTMAAAAVLLLQLTACQVPEKDPAAAGIAAITLAGNPVGTTLIIDNLLSFQVTSENRQMQFKVRPGEHRIRIERNGTAVLDRIVTLVRDQVLELTVP